MPAVSKHHSAWQQVAELLTEGRSPRIELPAAAEVIEPRRPRGRPAKDRTAEFPTRTPSGKRLRCRASGCRERLRAGDRITCSDACAQAVRSECMLLLGVLDGHVSPKELPPYMWTDRLRRKRTL